MALFRNKKRLTGANPTDENGAVNPTGDPAFDHPLLLREDVKKNANGDVVKLIRYFDDGEGGEVKRAKRIIPPNADETVTETQTVYPWVDEA